MAVAFKGFSIREYASKMRSVDVVKCWPFSRGDSSDDASTSIIEALLPPITVTKFRWWSHELALARSTQLERKHHENKNTDSSNCLGQASRQTKAKSKPPKKRSIVEIFSVAPQIQTKVVDDDETDGDGDDDCFKRKVVVSNLKTSKKKKMKQTVEDDVAVTMVNRLRRKKKDKSIAKKGKAHKRRQQVSGNPSITFNDQLCRKKLEGDSSFYKQEPSPKLFNAQKKHRVDRTSQLIGKHQKPLFPVRGILKNCAKDISGQNNSMIRKEQHDSQLISHGIHQSDKHVRFSDKDALLGVEKKKILLDAFVASSEKDQYTEIDKEFETVDVNGIEDDISTSSENGTFVQLITEKNQLDSTLHYVDEPNLFRPLVRCQEKVKQFPEKHGSLSHVAASDDNLPVFHECHISEFFSPLEDGQTPIINAHLDNNVFRASSSKGKLIDQFVDPIHGVDARNTKEFFQPSSPFSVSSKSVIGRLPFLSRSSAENTNFRTSQYQPLCCQSPSKLMGCFYSYPDWKQRASIPNGNCMEDEFFGLPLNSQGELIPLSSSSKGGFQQLNKNGSIAGSSSGLPMHNFVPPRSTREYTSVNEINCMERADPREQLNFLSAQNYVKENPTFQPPSRPGVPEWIRNERENVQWLDSGRRKNHSVHNMNLELNPINSSWHGYRQYDQVQNQNLNGAFPHQDSYENILFKESQPTMRLMGKDVAVGRSSNDIHRFDDRKVGSEKEIVTDHSPFVTGFENSMQSYFQQEWDIHGNETAASTSEIQNNRASHSNLLMNAPHRTRFSYPNLHWESNFMFQNATIDAIPSSRVHPFSHPPTSPASFIRPTNFNDPFMCAPQSLQFLSGGPVSSTLNTCSHMGAIPAAPRYQHDLPQGKNLPFLRPICGQHVQTSWVQGSANTVPPPPWLLHASQKQSNTLFTPSCVHSEFGDHYPYATSGTNYPTAPSTHNAPPLVPCSCSPLNHHSHMNTSVGPAYIAPTPLVPVLQGVQSTSINMNYKNRVKAKEKRKPNSLGVEEHNLCKKTKSIAAGAHKSSNHAKMLNIAAQNSLSTAIGTGGNTRSMQCYCGPFELNSNRVEASEAGRNLNETHNNALQISPTNDSYKVDGMARSGPTKLRAGAKHILKPSPNIDQDNSRLIHSTVPFAAATISSCAEFPKVSQIYRF